MSDLEENIKQFKGKKPDMCYRYVDDTFILMHGTSNEISLFVKFMNKLEESTKLTIEMQNDNKLPVLDVMVERSCLKLITYVYRKPTYFIYNIT
jgi:hypothetical protein